MASRKSTRLVKSPNNNLQAKDDDYISRAGDTSEEEEPKRKVTSSGRKRGAKGPAKQPPAKKRRRNRGLLKDVVEMPFDIVYEIFGKLSPADLLNLSQTSKDLRNILLSRSSASIWMEARRNFPGLPDCPPDLSEPQYAYLCFTKHCMMCLRWVPSTYNIWSARIRLCESCFEEECTTHYQKAAVAIDIMPSLSISTQGHHNYTQVYYHKASVDKWYSRFFRVKEKARAAVEQELRTVHEHGEACSAWFTQHQREIAEQKEADINEKGNLIVEYAKKMGWTDEFILSPEAADLLKQEKRVHRACTKNLTERDFENLENTINKVLGRVRAKRLANTVNILLGNCLPLLEKVMRKLGVPQPGDS